MSLQAICLPAGMRKDGSVEMFLTRAKARLDQVPASVELVNGVFGSTDEKQQGTAGRSAQARCSVYEARNDQSNVGGGVSFVLPSGEQLEPLT